MTTVLTIDASKIVQSMVARYLATFGCTLLTAHEGRHGVELARSHRPDLVLLDVSIPGLDGRQVLAELRKDAATKEIPVIVLTAESGRALVMEIAKLGVHGYVVKPFHEETFRDAVGRVLAAATATASPVEEPTIDPRAVLVVDDSERVLALARTTLAPAFTVATAASGEDAAAQYARTRPGVAVIDLVMPGMDGFATLAALQRLGRPACIALAVRGDVALHERARKAGFVSVVEKPFREGELLQHVQQATNAPSSADDLVQQCVGEAGGCPVFSLPSPPSKLLARLMPGFGRKLRALAEDGNDKLILDVAQVAQLTPDHVTMLARLLAEAGTLGIRTAICAPDPAIIDKLRHIAETRDAPYASTRDAARRCLQ